MSTSFEKLLAEAAKKLNLSEYTIDLDTNAQKGDGFLGEFYKVSITDKETNHAYHLMVKKAPTEKVRREQHAIKSVYKNEIWFYSEIVPAFRKFELDHRVPEPFDSIANYVTSDGKIGEEAIALEDLTKLGYLLREKDLLLDDQHATHIFKAYGHFHAISFCLKRQKPEEFDRLTKPLINIWKEIGNGGHLIHGFTVTFGKAKEGLDSALHGPVLEKLQKYLDDIKTTFLESCNYKGKHFGILHGDCWSNNMMFQYENSNLEAMKLIDFQLTIPGTPVFDLSYFFYTGGSKKLFDKLEHYLDIYYESFSTAAKNLGCDPEELLPREALSEDWKTYSKFGMMMSILITKVKLLSKADTLEVIKAADNQKEVSERPVGLHELKYDEEIFLSRTRDILLHMHEIDAL